MSTTTINEPAPSGSAKAQSKQPVTIALIREKLTTEPGKFILFAAQFLLSLVTIFYLRGVIRFAYNSLFYRLEIPADMAKSYCFEISKTCFEYALLMLFTRRQLITRLVILCAMPFYFPIFLFNYQRLELVIPLGIMIIVTYLASGTGEGAKTILGAVFLMFYIIGAIVYFVMQSVLTPPVSETVIARDVSPLGNYRFEVVQQLDRADGNTYVALEPNHADIKFDHSTWRAKGLNHEIYHERPLDVFTYEWDTQDREIITQSLLRLNPDITFTLNADQMCILGFNAGYTKDYTVKQLSRFQLRRLGYVQDGDIIAEKFPRFWGTDSLIKIEKDRTLRLNFDQMVELGLSPTYDVRLADLTDDDLAKLGVPEKNEILRVNNVIVFRQYVAVLENTFGENTRSLTAIFENGDLPEVDPKGLDLDELRRQREEAKAAETTTVPTETTTESTETTESTTETTAAAAA